MWASCGLDSWRPSVASFLFSCEMSVEGNTRCWVLLSSSEHHIQGVDVSPVLNVDQLALTASPGPWVTITALWHL